MPRSYIAKERWIRFVVYWQYPTSSSSCLSCIPEGIFRRWTPELWNYFLSTNQFFGWPMWHAARVKYLTFLAHLLTTCLKKLDCLLWKLKNTQFYTIRAVVILKRQRKRKMLGKLLPFSWDGARQHTLPTVTAWIRAFCMNGGSWELSSGKPGVGNRNGRVRGGCRALFKQALTTKKRQKKDDTATGAAAAVLSWLSQLCHPDSCGSCVILCKHFST